MGTIKTTTTYRNTDMLLNNRDYTADLNKILNAIDAGFTSKSAKKDAMYNLKSIFEAARDECERPNRDIVFAMPLETRCWPEGLFEISCKELHHFKPVHVEFLKNLGAEDHGVNALELTLKLRDIIKAEEIGIKPLTANQLTVKFEREVAEVTKDNGFRTNNWISWTSVFCMNEFGTQWMRQDWKHNGRQISFANAQVMIGKDLAHWDSKGRPFMGKFSRAEITEFYADQI